MLPGTKCVPLSIPYRKLLLSCLEEVHHGFITGYML